MYVAYVWAAYRWWRCPSRARSPWRPWRRWRPRGTWPLGWGWTAPWTTPLHPPSRSGDSLGGGHSQHLLLWALTTTHRRQRWEVRLYEACFKTVFMYCFKTVFIYFLLLYLIIVVNSYLYEWNCYVIIIIFHVSALRVSSQHGQSILVQWADPDSSCRDFMISWFFQCLGSIYEHVRSN